MRGISSTFKTLLGTSPVQPVVLIEILYLTAQFQMKWKRLAFHHQNITFEGNVYQAQLGSASGYEQAQDAFGEIDIAIFEKDHQQSGLWANNTNMFNDVKNKVSGVPDLRDSLIVVHKVLLDNLTEGSITDEFICNSISVNDEVYQLHCASRLQNPNTQFPPYTYVRTTCRWIFKSVECGFQNSSGLAFSSCPKSIEGCRERKNTKRYGAMPGVPDSRLNQSL